MNTEESKDVDQPVNRQATTRRSQQDHIICTKQRRAPEAIKVEAFGRLTACKNVHKILIKNKNQ